MKARFSISPLSCLLLLALAIVPGVQALQVSDLYSQRIAVANQSDAERSRAFREALEAVILKVTGELRWVDHPVVQQALGNAQSYVEAFSYSSETLVLPAAEQSDTPAEEEGVDGGVSGGVSAGVNGGVNGSPVESADPEQGEAIEAVALEPQVVEQRYVDVDFAASLIDELLSSADIPVWDSNRPSVLVWMVLQNPAGERSMLTADINAEIIELMQSFAAQRGLPIIFPVLDFEDRRSLSDNQVWTLDEEAIREASGRYGADSVLAGRLHFTASGELVGLWQFLFQDSALVFDGFDEELQPYLFAPLDRVTNQLAQYFAIVPEDTDLQNIRLRVDGVGDLQAYAALLTYVSNLGLVETVSMAALDGERLELELGLVGDSQQLDELIALDRDLLPISASSSQESAILHYRWTR